MCRVVGINLVMSIFLHQWQIYQHHFKSCIIIYLSNFQSLNVRYLNNLLYYIDNSMNKDVLTSVCRFLCEYKFSTPLIVHQGIWLLDHTISQFFFSFYFLFFFFFFFLRNSSKMNVSLCISTSNWWEFVLLHILTSTW